MGLSQCPCTVRHTQGDTAISVVFRIISFTIAALVIAAAYICYRLGFTVPQQVEADLFKFPDTEQYAPFREEMTAMVKAALAIPYEDVWITSGDGLKLHGKCYTSTPDAPVQIMFHGYKSGAERDFCGGLQVAVHGGFNVLLVDQRALRY